MQISWTDIAAVSGSLAFIVLVSYLVSLIKRAVDTLSQAQSTLLPQVQSTMAALEKAAEAHTRLAVSIESMVSEEFPPVIRNIDRVSSDLGDLTSDIKDKIRQTQGLFDAAMDTCETVMAVSGVARSGLTGLAAQISGITTGIKASVEFLTRNFIKKRRQL
jgi:ABC-type transporter Mla subunit MlaD